MAKSNYSGKTTQWFKGSNELLHDTSLTAHTRLVGLELISHRTRTSTDEFYYQSERIASTLGIREKAVRNALKELETAGYLQLSAKKLTNNKKVYRLNDSKLYFKIEDSKENADNATETSDISTLLGKSVDCSTNEKEALKRAEIEEAVKELMQEEDENIQDFLEGEEMECSAPAVEYRSMSRAAKEPLQSTISDQTINYIHKEDNAPEKAENTVTTSFEPVPVLEQQKVDDATDFYKEASRIEYKQEDQYQDRLRKTEEMMIWIFRNMAGMQPTDPRMLEKYMEGENLFGVQEFGWGCDHVGDNRWKYLR